MNFTRMAEDDTNLRHNKTGKELKQVVIECAL